jgi:hypothetical protein
MSDNIESRIRKTRTLKESSIKTYISSLKNLNKKLKPTENFKNLNNTDFLRDYDEVMKIIDKEEKLTSKKNRLTAVLVALNSDENQSDEHLKLISRYTAILKEYGETYIEFLKTQQKTKTQQENWITYDELIGVVNQIMQNIKHSKINSKTTLTKQEFDLLQQLVILRTYLFFPLRNDFAMMKILKNKDYKELIDFERDNANFLVLKTGNKKEFKINQYKTQKHLGNKSLIVPSKLNRVINLWLKHNTSGWFLVKSDRNTPMTPNGITKFLNKIFRKYSGKKISTSMLRHIQISHLLRDDPTILENETEERLLENTFLHSKSMNQLYRKLDNK